MNWAQRSATGKYVLAKCTNCGEMQRRWKGRSGLGHSRNGTYCGTMRVVEWLLAEEIEDWISDGD